MECFCLVPTRLPGLLMFVWVSAKTCQGTGKTVALAIGCIHSLDEQVNYCQALILTPTRELASQTQKLVDGIGEFCKIHSTLCVGGGSVRAGK